MKNLGILAVIGVGLCAAVSAGAGCSSSSSSSTSNGGQPTSSSSSTSSSGTTTTTSSSTTSSSTTTTTSSTNPPPPAIGAQIDRFGRPAINTALNHAFDANATTAGTAKDTYNQDADPSKWAGAYKSEFASNLAILDSLDTKCGNQLLAGSTATAGRYDVLAGALADDRVWLNTAGAACTTYLAVEVNAVGVMTNTDCGGRGLDYDVIDTSYSALAAGAFSGVGDGVPKNDVTNSSTFPYLAAPH